jgi:hypothetical protein
MISVMFALWHQTTINQQPRIIYCDFHCWISASLICLSLFTFGEEPVATPFASSTKPPIWVLFETAYCAVLALTRMMPMRGSSGPPSCLPSPRSPIHAFNPGE